LFFSLFILNVCKGLACETLICDKEPIECRGLTASQCPLASIYMYCPVLCGRCIGYTSTTTTTVSSCSNALGCLNGGRFNLETCSCVCYAAFSGKLFNKF
jgi:hypothetical protein